MAQKSPLDSALRDWVRIQVKNQQRDLGEALEAAGLRKPGRGQVWVSRYTKHGSADADIDHLLVIARFFERSLSDLLQEVVAVTPTAPERESAAQARAFLTYPPAFRRWVLSIPRPVAEELALVNPPTSQLPRATKRGPRAAGGTKSRKERHPSSGRDRNGTG